MLRFDDNDEGLIDISREPDDLDLEAGLSTKGAPASEDYTDEEAHSDQPPDAPQNIESKESKPNHIVAECVAVGVAATGSLYFPVLAFDCGKDPLNPFFGLDKDNLGLPLTAAGSSALVSILFQEESLMSCYNRFRKFIDEYKRENSAEQKAALNKAIFKNGAFASAGFIASTAFINDAYDRLESILGDGAIPFVTLLSLLFFAVGTRYMSPFIDDLNWCFSIIKNPVFKQREEVAFFLNKLTPLLYDLPKSDIEKMVECRDAVLEVRVQVLAEILKSHHIDVSSLSHFSKESFLNGAFFLLGSARSFIMWPGSRTGVERFFHLEKDSPGSILPAAIAFAVNVATQGSNTRVTANKIRNSTIRDNLSLYNLVLGLVALFSSSAVTKFVLNTGFGSMTPFYALLSFASSMANAAFALSKNKARFFKSKPQHKHGASEEQLTAATDCLKKTIEEVSKLDAATKQEEIDQLHDSCKAAQIPLEAIHVHNMDTIKVVIDRTDSPRPG